jgi:hypothetical protein
MASKGKYPVLSKINLNNVILKQARNFNYLSWNITWNYDEDFNGKVNRFQNVRESISRTPRKKNRT